MRSLSLLSTLALSAVLSSLPALAHDHAVLRGRLREAELNLSRQQQLTNAQLVGHAVLDTVQANVDALQARIAYATEQVSVAEA